MEAVLELRFFPRLVVGVVAFGVMIVSPTPVQAQADAPESTPTARPDASEPSPQSVAPELTSEAARLTYRAPEQCPSEEEFRRQVDAQVDRPWEAPPEAFARRVEVVVEHDGDEFTGRMQFTDALGNPATRTVAGDDCDEVVEGIAIVTALAIESLLAPEARGEVADEPEPKPDPPPPEPPELPVPIQTPPPSPPLDTGWDHELGLSGGLLWGLGPAPAPVVGARWAVGPARRSDLVAFRIAGADTTRVTEQDVQLRFQLLAARLESCPVAAALGDRLTFPLCGGVELGFVSARGYENPPRIVEGARDVAPWAAATVGPGLRVASRSVFVRLEPTLLILIPSWTYRVEMPKTDVFSTPRVAASLVAAAGVRFP